MTTKEEILKLAKECGLYLDGVNQQQPLYVIKPEELEAIIAKAGEVMRERCVNSLANSSICFTAQEVYIKKLGNTAIRALPGITLEDLKRSI